MSEILAASRVPVQLWEDGTLRVGGTRVSLDSLIKAHLEGATAEDIVERFPVLSLADVYLSTGFYLKYKPAVDDYLAQRAQDADSIRRDHEQDVGQAALTVRDRLIRRRE